jgi:hypothetical protein
LTHATFQAGPLQLAKWRCNGSTPGFEESLVCFIFFSYEDVVYHDFQSWYFIIFGLSFIASPPRTDKLSICLGAFLQWVELSFILFF